MNLPSETSGPVEEIPPSVSDGDEPKSGDEGEEEAVGE
jgi:hypothetical protein